MTSSCSSDLLYKCHTQAKINVYLAIPLGSVAKPMKQSQSKLNYLLIIPPAESLISLSLETKTDPLEMGGCSKQLAEMDKRKKMLFFF